MTPLLFRAWHEKQSKMIYFDDITFWNDYEFWGSPENNQCQWRGNINELKVMQSTGLKDKNGREIFEGDILKSNCACADVNWFDGRFVIDVWNLSTFLQDKDSEIIGSIYKNPDLLPPN